MQENSKLEKAIYVSWEDSESGHGTMPDGCSLHINEDKLKEFVKEYCNGISDKTSREYSRPVGRIISVKVSRELYNRIKESENGLRILQEEESRLARKMELVYSKQRNGWVK
jgi:hypothetical protein